MSDPGIQIASEAAKAAAAEIAKPVSEIVGDTLGGLIGDRLRNWRQAKPAWQERNQRETAERAANLLQDRGIKQAPDDTNPVHVEELLVASKDTTAPDLKELYARLIAATMDADRAGHYRREFVGIVQALEPLDARALPMLAAAGGLAPSRLENIASRLSASQDAVRNSFRNLKRLDLIVEVPGAGPETQPSLTSLGREFMACVR